MSVYTTQITYYLHTCIRINKQLGGTRGYEAQASSKDKFAVMRDNISKNFHYIKAKLQQKEKKRGADAIQINQHIKQKLDETKRQIERMKEQINIDPGTETSKDLKFQIAQRLKQQAQSLQAIINQVEGSARGLISSRKHNILTDTDMRAQLLQEGQKNTSNRIQSKQKKGKKQPTQMEMEAIKNWKERDIQIDERVDGLIDNMQIWKAGIIQAGKLIDQTDAQIQDLTKQVDQVNDDLLRSNKQLKGIVQKFRKPHKFCLDIALILILIGLIVAIIKISTS